MPGDSRQFHRPASPPNTTRDGARPNPPARPMATDFLGGIAPPQKPAEVAAEFKRKTAELQIAGLTLARQQGNLSIDLLLRLALVKFLRDSLNSQYVSAQEQCRSKLRAIETPGNGSLLLRLRERIFRFQLNKRAVLRKCGQELYETLREIEKETVLHMRRSIFGEAESAAYELFLNRLDFFRGRPRRLHQGRALRHARQLRKGSGSPGRAPRLGARLIFAACSAHGEPALRR